MSEIHAFAQLGCDEKIVRAISEMGFTNPTPIQEKIIPQLLQNNLDVVALAQTGTGKTAAFGLPLLQKINAENKFVQALILCPTRELCMQITNDIQAFSAYISNLEVVAVYGGSSILNQLRAIEKGVQIIVATPGRLVDIMTRKKQILKNVSIAVLDEADEMLNMGFKDDLDAILSHTPSEKNTWLFSATMPNEVLQISKNYMHNPMEVSVGNRNQTNENISHGYYVVHAKDRYNALKRIADYHPDIFAIIFCRTKIETQQVADSLIKDGYDADALHGDLSQAQRDYVMNRYRNKNLQLLVATDVAARGIDVNDVTHVIHFNLPDDLESYTHRSGRTARAGKKGHSLAIIHMKETGKIKMLEKITKQKFEKLQIPNGVEVCEKQMWSLVNKAQKVEVNEEEIAKFIEPIQQSLAYLSKEEIVKKFISIEFNRFLNYYKNAPDLNAHVSHSASSDEDLKAGIKCFLTLGRKDNFNNNKDLKTYIADVAGIKEKEVVWVDIRPNFSFIELAPQVLEKTLDTFKNIYLDDRKIALELRESGSSRGKRNKDRGGRSERSDRSDRSDRRGNSDRNFGGDRNFRRDGKKGDRNFNDRNNKGKRDGGFDKNKNFDKSKNEAMPGDFRKTRTNLSSKPFDLNKELQDLFAKDSGKKRK